MFRRDDLFDLQFGKDHPKIVLWSGGADSTLVLAQLAELNKLRGCSEPIYSLYVDVDYIDKDKVASEKNARRRFIEYMNTKGYYISDSTITIRRELSYEKKCEFTSLTFAQQFLWQMIALQVTPDNADVFFGYIAHDDVWHMNEQRQKMFEAVNAWRDRKLHFYDPLRYYTKADVYNELHKNGILDYVWTCETPSKPGVPCRGSFLCHPCTERYHALIELALDGHEWAHELLERDYDVTFTQKKDWIRKNTKLTGVKITDSEGNTICSKGDIVD